MAEVTFHWTITGEDAQQVEEEIVEVFLQGYQADFIQQVLNGRILDLPSVTFQEKKDFAIAKFSEMTMQTIVNSKLERELQAVRSQIRVTPHKLPKVKPRNNQ